MKLISVRPNPPKDIDDFAFLLSGELVIAPTISNDILIKRAANEDLDEQHGSNSIPSARHDRGDWRLYETLKHRYTTNVRSCKEYEAACRRAADEAGV